MKIHEQSRAPAISEPLLARFADFLAERIGLHFPPERWHELDLMTRRAARDLGFTDVEACARDLLSLPLSRQKIDVLASHLTVGETYFFRDHGVFACLERAFSQLIAARRTTDPRLRIWSAGCSSGEEAYSVAMLLATLLPDIDEWNVCVLATDINPQALEKARRGEYNEWSFRNVPPHIKDRFFTRAAKGRFQIADRIKALVSFSHLNLVDDGYPSLATNTNAMDVILCRNVLMYFRPARSRELISRLSLSLLDTGWLFLSPVDAPLVNSPRLEEVAFPGATVYRKAAMAKLLGPQPVSPGVPIAAAVSPVRVVPRAVPAWKRPSSANAPLPAREPEPAPSEQATALYAHGRYAEVIALLLERAAQQPADSATLALLARSYANQGQLADAERWCVQAVAGDRFNPAWLYLLSTILQERNELGAAETALGQALYLDPDHALAHFALGTLLRRRGKEQGAQRHLRNALLLLERLGNDEVLEQADGLTAGRLADVIRSMAAGEAQP